MEQIDVSYPDHITIHTVKSPLKTFDTVVVSIKKQGITMTYSIPLKEDVTNVMKLLG